MQTCSSTTLPIYDVTPFTMLDFPDNTACVIWFSGCNMRCPYCHNPEIVKGKGKTSIDDVFEFLNKRKGLLDGVVLSGGEATSYKDIIGFTEEVRKLGYKVKLDTNGTHPKIVKEMLDKELIKYLALDYKAPESKYVELTKHKNFEKFSKTLDMLINQDDVTFEVRTTVHSDVINEDDINEIIKDLSNRGYKGTFYVQNYINNDTTPTLGNLPPQKKTIDINKLNIPSDYMVEFRNFSN